MAIIATASLLRCLAVRPAGLRVAPTAPPCGGSCDPSQAFVPQLPTPSLAHPPFPPPPRPPPRPPRPRAQPRGVAGGHGSLRHALTNHVPVVDQRPAAHPGA